MKKLPIIASLIILSSLLFSMTNLHSQDYPRMKLVEALTSSDCGPCAQFWPQIDPIFAGFDSIFIPIKYHINIGNQDPMCNLNPTMSHGRGNYYYGQSLSAPSMIINGTPINLNQIDNDFVNNMIVQGRSPYLVTVTQTNNANNISANIKVKANTALTNKVLRIALLEWDINFRGNNGESIHKWVARDFTPSIEGQYINVAANSEESFSITFPYKDEYVKGQLYVVAFIQDDETKEILQAGSSLNDISSKAFYTSVDNNNHMLIDRNTTINKVLTLHNESTKEYTYQFGFNIANTFFRSNDGLTISIDKPEVTLAPGQTEDITFTIQVNDQAHYAHFALVPIVKDNSAISQNKTFIFSILTKDAKHAIVYSRGKILETLHTSSDVVFNFLSTYKDAKKDLVGMPLIDADLFKHYDLSKMSDIKSAAFLFDYWTGENLTTSTVISQQMKNLLAGNKRVLLGDEYYLSTGFVPDQPFQQGLKTFLTNDLKIKDMKYYERVTLNSQGSITGFLPFKVKGNSDDLIGKYIGEFEGNTDFQNYHSTISENFSLNTTIDDYTKPIMFYEDGKIAGIRKEFSKGKIVVLGFGINSFSDDNARSTMLTSIYDWLLDDLSDEAKLTVHLDSKNMISFPNTKVGESANASVTISNTGRKALTITTIDVDDKENFSIIAPALPLILQTGESIDLPITFSPKQSMDYYASIELESNSYMESYKYVSLQGKGLGDIVEPNISISTTTLDFGQIEPKTTKTMTFKIKNTGNKTLIVNNLLIKNDNTGSFEVTEMNLLPLYVQASDEETINVIYSPVEEGTHAALLEVYSDDPDHGKIDINMTGIAKTISSVNDPVSSLDGNFSMKTLPNPMSNEGFLHISALKKSIDLNVQIVDATGKLIQNVFSNSNFIGSNKIGLNINELSNGYYIISANVDGKVYSMPLIIKK